MGLFIFRLPLNVNTVTEDFARAGGLSLRFAAYREQGKILPRARNGFRLPLRLRQPENHPAGLQQKYRRQPQENQKPARIGKRRNQHRAAARGVFAPFFHAHGNHHAQKRRQQQV